MSPGTGCIEDIHCPSGSYCVQDSLSCRVCFDCRTVNRENPLGVKCVTTVSQCGACITGYSEAESQSGSSWECVLLPPLFSPQSWVAILATLLVAALLLCIAAAFVLRNIRAYKMQAAISASDQADREPGLLPPPPYHNADTALPCHEAYFEDASKHVLMPSCPAARATDDAHQRARVFCAPSYGGEQPAAEPARSNGREQSCVATETAPPVPLQDLKPSRVRQCSSTSTESVGDGDGDGDDSGYCGRRASFTAHNQSAFIINVIKNITTVQQQNDLV